MKTTFKILKRWLPVLALIIVPLMATSCSKDDPEPDPIATPNPKPDPVANNAPGAFDLIGVTNGANKVDVLPTFSWNVSTDPDGDGVTYDLLLDEQTNPTTLFASDIAGTSFKVIERLHLTTPYYWKVVAKDNKGKSVASGTYTFTTRGLNFPTAPVTTAAFPKGLYGHTTVAFQNYLWVIGGRMEGDSYTNKVWYSANGSNWFDFLSLVPFTPRVGHTTVVFDDKLWVIGGYDKSFKNDVWYSEDGAFWVEATTVNEKFSPRYDHTTTVFDNKLWVIGGATINSGPNSGPNDIWYSEDGANWTKVPGEAPFPARSAHTTAVFDNKLWVVGGSPSPLNGSLNDVWYSSDGLTWAEARGGETFTPRFHHTTVVYDQKLWVIGGFAINGRLNDVWYSSDGIVWAMDTGYLPFSGRGMHTTVDFDNKLWVIGGHDGAYRNDVWALD